MVDKQISLEAVVSDLAFKIDSVRASIASDVQSEIIGSIGNNLANLDDRVRKSTAGIEGQLVQLTAVCKQFTESVQSTTSHSPPTVNIDRSCNVVISGIVEDRNRDTWNTTLGRALAVAAGGRSRSSNR